MKITRLFSALAMLGALVSPTANATVAQGAAKAMDTAYLVMAEKNAEAAAPLLEYIGNSGTKHEILTPKDLNGAISNKYLIVIGSPKDNDDIAQFAKKTLTPKQWDNAMEMGKSGPVIATSGDSKVLFLFSDYSLKSMIAGSKDVWTEIFYDWYDIPLSITQIIGY